MEIVETQPAGTVVGGRSEAFDDDWNTVEALIRLDETRFKPDALARLDAFSHLEVVFLFHLVEPASVHTSARRPRGNPEWPRVGISVRRARSCSRIARPS